MYYTNRYKYRVVLIPTISVSRIDMEDDNVLTKWLFVDLNFLTWHYYKGFKLSSKVIRPLNPDSVEDMDYEEDSESIILMLLSGIEAEILDKTIKRIALKVPTLPNRLLMLIAQAHKEFQVFMDKVDSQSLPDFLSKEIDIFIHEAELRVVKQAYGGNNLYKTPYGSTQKRTDDLSTLLVTKTIPFTNDEATLPEDYMFLDRIMVKVSNPTILGAYTTPYLCSTDKLNTVLTDPFNKSVISYPVVWLEGGKVMIDAPDFTAIDAKVSYIKYPRRVDKLGGISSELPEQKQKEAVQLAVRIALGTIESPRVQEMNDQLGGVE